MALGKGLDSILKETKNSYKSDLVTNITQESNNYKDDILELPIDTILLDSKRYRRDTSLRGLEELGNSIKRYGLLHPIIVTPKGNRWLLVAGERRLRAHKLIGLKRIKALVIESNIVELALVENIQREALNPIELAKAYRELLNLHSFTKEDLASILNRSISQIENTLKLLSLSAYAQDMLLKQKITQQDAIALFGLSKDEQQSIIDKVIKDDLSVKEAKALINRQNCKRDTLIKEGNYLNQESIEVLKELLPFDFKVRENTLEIEFNSKEKLQKFIDFLNKREK